MHHIAQIAALLALVVVGRFFAAQLTAEAAFDVLGVQVLGHGKSSVQWLSTVA